MNPTEADLRQLIEQILGEFDHAKHRFRLEAAGDSCGTWDIDRVLQILANLIGNAVRHSPPDTPIRIGID